MPDQEMLGRLRRFQSAFPRFQDTWRRLVEDGQHPSTLFIGCSDSRVVPYLLMGCGPGELFLVRNVGNLIPPYDDSAAHGSGAAIEFAVLNLGVRNIVVCGHNHCGAMRALYEPPPPEARHLNGWLTHARGAILPVQMSEEALRRVEQRNVALQLEHLMTYPMVGRGIEAGTLSLHGWYYMIDEGKVLVLDLSTGHFEEIAGEDRRLVLGPTAPPAQTASPGATALAVAAPVALAGLERMLPDACQLQPSMQPGNGG
jgi:carbonic anhydrase